MRPASFLTALLLFGCPSSSTPDAAAGELDAGLMSDAGGAGGGGGDSGAPFVWDGGCVPLGADFCGVNPQPFSAQVNAISARADDDVWLVGAGSLLAHWNGARLEVHALEGGGPATFWSVGSVRSDCAWAAGGFTVARWDGQRWRAVAAPPEAVDQLIVPDCEHPLVMRIDADTIYEWTGTGWVAAVTGSQLFPPVRSFTALGSGGGRAWLAGYDAQRPRALELTDAGFVDRTPVGRDLYNIQQWLLSANRVIAVDQSNSSLDEWDGTTWTRTDLPFPNTVRRFALDPQGDPLALLPSQVAQLDGGQFVALHAPLYRQVLGGDLSLLTLGVTPGGDLWVGGEDGALAHRSGTTWNTFTSGAAYARKTGARVGDEVWISGALGLTVLKDGQVEWRNVSPANSTCDYGAIASFGGETLLGGYEFTSTRPVLRWDGVQFKGEAVPGGQPRVNSLFRVGDAWWGVVGFINVPSTSAVISPNDAGVWSALQSGGPGDFGVGWSDGRTAVVVGSTAGQRRWQRAVNGVWGAANVSPAPPLNALAGPDPARLFAVSDQGIHRFDDGAWTTLASLTGQLSLRTVVVDADTVFAAGTRVDPGYPSATQGVLVRWRNGVVSERLIPSVTQVEGLFNVDGVLFVVGVDGAVVRVLNP
ncbi:MAG: hypothetical protein U0228_22755 [Myxococcaceae bacterium]